MNIDPKSFNTPEVSAFGPNKIDDLGRAVVTLTKEVCVLADRLAVLEAKLEKAGVASVDELDTWEPDEATQARIDARMGAIIKAVLKEMSGEA